MKSIILTLLSSFLLITLSYSQPTGTSGAGQRQGMGGMGQNGHFYGKIVDASSGKGVDASSVQLITTKFDPVKKQRKDTVINGMLTKPNGDFSLENVPIMGEYRLKITAIGYKTLEQKVSFLTPEMQKKIQDAVMAARTAPKDSTKPAGQQGTPNMMEVMRKALGNDMSQLMNLADKDLGNIKIAVDPNILDNVTVTGTRSMTLAVDRKIFNVDKNLAASGTNATEIMRQIPSVNVDIDGNVTVRNATPTIFVDGRPTTLTLDQIPADAIQSVELITNPSAKYDASGGGAAILNIVMKKNRKSGYNGSVRSGIDSRGKPNIGGDFNVKQGKINTFVNGMLATRKSISNTDINTDYLASGTSPASSIVQNVDNTSQGYFMFLRGGIDYFADNRNTFTLSGNVAHGVFDNNETNNMMYDSFYNPIKQETAARITASQGNFRNFGGTLSYKHLFTKPGHELTADINLNGSKSENDANFNNQFYNADSSPKGNPQQQKTNSSTGNTYWVFQSDYSNPITKNLKLEAGIRGQIRDFSSKNMNYVYNESLDEFVLNRFASSNYEYTDQVYAAYTTLTGKAGRFGYNVGMRVESSNYNGTKKSIEGTDSSFKVSYPVTLFPSAFLTYKLSDKSDLQVNYTRRINRPNFFQLIPFVDYSDPLNLRVGNPGLKPEFTNSLEANYSYQFSNSHNILISTYYKLTTDLITGYQFKGLNVITGDSAIYNTYINANSSTRYGIEFTSRNALTKKFDVITNLNFYNATINSENIKENLNNSQNSFFGKMTLTQRIGKSNQWTVQANGDYQSKTVAPVSNGGGGRGGFFGGQQSAGSNGYVNPSYGVDMSVRREFIKNKNGQGYQASLTLSMNDIFRTRIYDVQTFSDFFQQHLMRRRDPQVLRLQFNWRFGKIDTNLFKRKNTKGDNEGMSESMQQGG